MAELLPITLDDMIVEVRRELRMRALKYPEWKRDASRNARNRLDRQWDVMEAVLKYLEESNGRDHGTMDR